MSRSFPSLRAVLLLILLAGLSCRHDSRPDDLPKLTPCVLTLTQAQAPLAGAIVNLYSRDSHLKWTISGITDASGRVALKTHGRFPGVPEGEYIVVVIKTEIEQPIKPTVGADGTDVHPGGPLTHYHLVDPQYSDRKTSPLHQTVQGRSVQAAFELGAPVRQKGKTVYP